MMTDHELLERALIEVAPMSPLAAELAQRFADDVAIADAELAVLERPRPLSVYTSPRLID